MSKDTPQPQQSEEVDLGQLFKLIGNAFDRFFRFIGSVFNKIFLAFVWLVFFIKKHFIKLLIAGIVGVILGIVKESTSEPSYKSYATIKQNYDTGENLYNSISYYNDLVNQKDYNTLKDVLGFKGNEASSILSFDIAPVVSENQQLQAFDKYIKTLDSVAASKIEYETFLENNKDYTHEFQQITIKAKARNSFKVVFDNIVKNIESNDYFEREQKKDITELENKERALKEALVKSDSLQNTYKRVLENNLDSKGSDIGITFEGNNEKDKTKEYDLYLNDLEIRRELVELEREKADKELIVEILSSKQDSGAEDTGRTLLGVSISPKMYYGLVLMSLTFLVLLGLRAIKSLDRYENKI